MPRKPGFHLSEDHKRKIGLANSISLLGKSVPKSVRKKISAGLSGKKKSPEHVAKLSGENSSSWKGDAVGYGALHEWVSKTLGKPNSCSVCKNIVGRMEWANKSGSYKRDVKDWIRLCVRCHRKMDGNIPNRWTNNEHMPKNKEKFISHRLTCLK